MQELPLLLFTLCEDFAIGSMIMLVVLELMNKVSQCKPRFAIGLIAFFVAVIGMIISLMHLGQPLRATNVLFGLGSSWLSREIVFFGVFTLFTFLYAIAAHSEKRASVARVFGIIAGIAGILALVATSICYMVPGVPAWNTAATPVMFFLAAAAFGFTFVKAMLSQMAKGESAGKWWIALVVCIIVFVFWRYMFYADIVVLVDTM